MLTIKKSSLSIKIYFITAILFIWMILIFCDKRHTLSSEEISSNEKILQTIFKKSTEVFIGDCAWHDSLSDSYGKRCSMPHLHIKADKEMFVKRNMELFAEQEMFLVSIDTVYTADVGNKKVVLVFIEFVPPEFDCRNCEPSIGVAAFIEGEKSNYYNLATFQEHLINYGSYGEITGDYSINNLGGNKFGITFKKGSMGQGTVEENVVIFVNDEHWYFNEAFSRTTYLILLCLDKYNVWATVINYINQ